MSNKGETMNLQPGQQVIFNEQYRKELTAWILPPKNIILTITRIVSIEGLKPRIWIKYARKEIFLREEHLLSLREEKLKLL